jgi:hypothetical protein
MSWGNALCMQKIIMKEMHFEFYVCDFLIKQKPMSTYLIVGMCNMYACMCTLHMI